MSVGVYATVCIGVIALPFLLALPLIPGWFREQRAIGRKREEFTPSFAGREARPALVTPSRDRREQLIAWGKRGDGAHVVAARLLDQEDAKKVAEKAARKARTAANAEALRLAEVRRFAEKKSAADKRAATRAAKRTADTTSASSEATL